MTAENLADHFGDHALRRLRAGELPEAESTRAHAHLEECGPCKARWRALEDEQRRFERELPFERFAAGVARAARRPAPTLARRLLPLAPLVAVAAAALLAVWTAPDGDGRSGQNRLKGGIKGTAEVALRIAAPAGGPQRDATPGAAEVLAPGERVRIGYKPGGYRFVASISVDERGEISPLYPEAGRSLEVEGGEAMQYLPGSLEFYGRGAERVIVILSDGPLGLDELRRAAQEAYDAANGDVVRMGELSLRATGVEQFHQTLLKP